MSSEFTPHQAKYFALQLTKQAPSNSIEKLATALSDAQVDLNPHQIDAALFAFRSPLSKGALLADEVGLGKTIEAGILLAQKWAERKRKLLIIAPATLRKQWNQELTDKFFLTSIILEKKSFTEQIRKGNLNPFKQDEIVICSYQFAKSQDVYIKQVNWDLVVIDEAHRLRNVYKPTNKVGNAIKSAISHSPKILLTATPLQNSLLELFGLIGIIDEHVFGDIQSFKEQFVNLQGAGAYDALKDRLKNVCQRTLRRQVLEYIKYTNRIAITQEFFPSDNEQKLYDVVSDYLQRDRLYALPNSQRSLMTLILRKLLASSSFAIAGTLSALINRLKNTLEEQAKILVPLEMNDVALNLEITEELEDEWVDDEEDSDEDVAAKILTPFEIEEVKHELALLEQFKILADSIRKTSKGEVLLNALKQGFEKLRENQANEKAIIFTESTRTQTYLLEILSLSEYKDKVVLFNGSNSDPKSKEIYKAWLIKHKGTDRITGSASADMRAALVEYFKDEAVIMVATEAAAEGINLQFCSLVVNFDLPWNPQRIEQRIGRCHRYGQKHDVVVVNFLNKANAADQRVFELLDQKFKLFSGVFGASDEVLGVLESGIDFEKKIAQIYQKCRTPDQIEEQFKTLRNELEERIQSRITDTKRKLLENFDEEVQEKLRVGKILTEEALSKADNWLWSLTKYYLSQYAEFSKDQNEFVLKKNPFPELNIHSGPYKCGKNIVDANTYRAGHPLAQKIIETCIKADTPVCEIEFDYSNSGRRISSLDNIKGKSGLMQVEKYTITALETEEYILSSAKLENNEMLDDESIMRILSLPAKISKTNQVVVDASLKASIEQKIVSINETVNSKNGMFFDEEIEKLDRWSEDKRKSLKAELNDFDDQIKEVKKQARNASNLPEKLELQKKVKNIEKRRDDAWKSYDLASKQISDQKDELLDVLQQRLSQSVEVKNIFNIRWKVI